MADDYSNCRDEWHDSGDPRWVWRVMRISIEKREPFPDWCLDYLSAVADGIEKAKDDMRAALPRILGFPMGRGRRRHNRDALRIEKFAVEFMLLVQLADDYSNYRDEWHDSGDPRWVWRVMRTCIETREPFPVWCLDYLRGVADGIEKVEDDMRAALPRLLGFPMGRGRRRHNRDALRIERFAVEFMQLVLRGVSPGHAREQAAQLHGMGYDDKDLSKYLRGFFKLKSLPTRSQQWRWKLVIAVWCMHHPDYSKRYPGLPQSGEDGRPAFDFR